MSTEKNEKIIITNLQPTGTALFGVTPIEALAYVLSETGFINNETKINDIPAYDLSKDFYAKRNKFRQTTRLGHILMAEGVITKNQLIEALSQHVDTGTPLGEALINMGICDPLQIKTALDKQNQLRSFDRF